jgi:hypothetical protein
LALPKEVFIILLGHIYHKKKHPLETEWVREKKKENPPIQLQPTTARGSDDLIKRTARATERPLSCGNRFAFPSNAGFFVVFALL